MGETAPNLEPQNIDVTPTPTPVSGVQASVRPPEVAAVSGDTSDLLGTVLDELGVEETAPAKLAPVVPIDKARAQKLAAEAAKKLGIKPGSVIKAELDKTSFDNNPAIEIPDQLQG